jgi:ABC-type polar amino acid transport system ATPase subunit
VKSQQSQGAKFPQSAAALIVRCCLNIVFQDYALFPNLDVLLNIEQLPAWIQAND